MIQLKVAGKNRVIRDKQISFQTEHDLHCRYRDHDICIAEQETGGYYVTVTDVTGMYAVQGGFGGQFCRDGIKSIEDCLVMCIKNILL